ncbi:MAG: hypothetical protein SFU85_08265 [Candidatus Methylacidiphilales bacterium]|nr:hypothetical protein [Candidatus Methylacidiphilales bacterium]
MIPNIPALDRLQALEEVAAAFVYSRDGRVLAAAVPKNYTVQILEQLIGHLRRITDLVDRAKIRLRELRFQFQGFTLWVKVFGQEHTLVVFIQPKASVANLRQPINLTVVNLERALLGGSDKKQPESAESLAAMAHRAEMELVRQDRGSHDQAYIEQLGTLMELFVGPSAHEVVGTVLREVEIGVTFDSRAEMLRLADMAGSRISSVERRKFFLEAAGDLVDRVERQMPAPAAGQGR